MIWKTIDEQWIAIDEQIGLLRSLGYAPDRIFWIGKPRLASIQEDWIGKPRLASSRASRKKRRRCGSTLSCPDDGGGE
jgi:hypothetical protein